MDYLLKMKIAIILMFVVLLGAYPFSNYLMVGREVTVTGTVQLHQLQDVWWIGKNTDVELRTYSGDTHHVELLGHYDFELYKVYTINFRWVVRLGGFVITGALISMEKTA